MAKGNILIICGGREFDPTIEQTRWFMTHLHNLKPAKVFHGGARGADRTMGDVAHELGFKIVEVHAKWRSEGSSAGPKRNARMLAQAMEEGPVTVIAFPGGKGTSDMVTKAIKAGANVIKWTGECLL